MARDLIRDSAIEDAIAQRIAQIVEFIHEDRIKPLEAKLAKAVEALEGVLGACDEGRMIPRPGHGAGGMTIEANVKGSIYTGVPAWPIEEARTALAELKGDKT
jgi:hypothetical protein